MDSLSLSTLGLHIQALRLERGWSLSQLANAAGIAKSNLSRLEQGNGNPTLDTIWRLAVQLNVPFGTLVSPLSVPLDEDGVQVRLIDQGIDTPQVDAYWMRCAPHTLRYAEAHTPGSCESLTLVSGWLEAGPIGNTQILTAGESITFAADQPHLYRTQDAPATLLLTVVYSAVGATP
ncbi:MULTISPECIES: helix-turn-helix domain-containing protein [unclassified Halomonas]|uniref:helix-turn-helix domain-containing protein n=1 Tax=unclassified Halomonas TaxID=2609666 RepID=UPI0006DA14C0|nr:MULTISPECIES: XRE family transcriptional regulator [unclassified Halomonas]KPQ28881.1 MAG: transcriptional regulator, XRE family with cupin sensor [Halomonas sp. HL-93]SBR50750.1 transcriptional regulator, XRE family with cupin sensor [Halomonas sp. HL-93]SNY97017.1 transcriptional regulator, XRE family with cupin sensor [Halomonas sp. hl-4]